MPHGGKFANKQVGWICSGVLSFLAAGFAIAAPSINGTSGTFNHKSSVTVSGSGFGTKSTAPPAVWDDASTGTVPTDNGKWDWYYPHYPDESKTYHLHYTTPINGVALPHSHVTRYLAGAHGEAGANGTQVDFWKDHDISVSPYIFASWYNRADPAWQFGTDLNNYKSFDHTVASSAYSAQGTMYGGLNPLNNNTDATEWGMYSLRGPALNPMNPRNGWIKTQIEWKISKGSDGFFRLYENGALIINYSGPTEGPAAPGVEGDGSWPGTMRSFVIGGYGNPYGQPKNWRYFADVFLDYTLARVVLANNADLSKATVIEPQIPTSWSPSSVTFSVNLGQHTSGQTAYLFVVDPSGTHNSTGFPVTVGGTSSGGGTSTAIPNPPGDVRVE